MCERHYTAATITELQRISLVAELRRRIELDSGALRFALRFEGAEGFAAGSLAALSIVADWLDELAPQCDDPDAPTLTDMAEGMKP